MKAPAISVVMPVFNALPYLDEAIESVLGQTRSDFEFVIYDDASTDGSSQRLKEWAKQDSRIKLVRGERNLGPALSSNAVVELASAPLIARMDADDVSLPDRLELQAAVMEQEPKAGIVASMCETIDRKGRVIRGPELWRLVRPTWSKPFPHASMMFRRDIFDTIGGYREECEYWEDFDFALRASEQAKILVLPRVLYRYRQSEGGTRLASDPARVEAALDLRYRMLDRVSHELAYEDLLEGFGSQAAGKVDPRVFVSLALLSVSAGRRPRQLRRFLSRARLRLDSATSISIVAVLWASASPRTFRGLLALISRLRNRRAGAVPTDKPAEWKLPSRLRTKVSAKRSAARKGDRRGSGRKSAPGPR